MVPLLERHDAVVALQHQVLDGEGIADGGIAQAAIDGVGIGAAAAGDFDLLAHVRHFELDF